MTEKEEKKGGLKSDGNEEILAGGALGVLAAGSAIVGAVSCPICIIGAPILLGIGAFKKFRAKKAVGKKLS